MQKRFLFTVVFLFSLFTSCELFNNPSDPRFLDGLHGEVAWANAERLIVTVGFPTEWGSSSQRGTGRCGDTRLGYPFQVEFGAMPGYGFEKWLAFPTSIYDELDKSSSASEIESSGRAFTSDQVNIIDSKTVSGSHIATVTIYTTEPVTLVPWCGDRPTIIQTNPPLMSSSFYYTRGQQIVIKFSMELLHEDDDGQPINFFGENLIQINGQNIDGTAWNGTGNFHDTFFYTPEYDERTQTITISPKDPPPPGYYNITVTVGMGVLATNGNGLSAPVSFSYRTNDEIVTRAYKAHNVWAIHDLNNPHVNSFFYQMAPAERDRRLRTNSSNDYEVHLYFSVSRSVGEIADIDPDTVRIAQIHYANIRGEEIRTGGSAPEEIIFTPYHDDGYNDLELMEADQNSAGLIYRQMNNATNPLGVNFYKVNYTFPAGTLPGIYRLVILPERAEPTQGAAVPADEWTTAVEEGRFVTVVIDKTPPNNGGSLILSGYYSTSRGTYNYSPHRDDRNLVINTDFSAFHDNDKDGRPLGIMLSNATPNIPWTRDDQRNLQWRWRIEYYCEVSNIDTRVHHYMHESNWMLMGTNPPPLNLFASTTMNNQNIIWLVEIQFRNALGYENDWTEMARIRYSSLIEASTIDFWSAEYSEDDNNGILTIGWDESPNNALEVTLTKKTNTGDIQVGDPFIIDETEDTISHILIEKLDASYSNITEYTIELRNIINGVRDPDSLETGAIWNIPGMKVVNNIMEGVYIVNDFSDNASAHTRQGTLRYALARAQADNKIVFYGVTPGETTIALTSALPSISENMTNMTIVGNGITLTRASEWSPIGNMTQLLRIPHSATVVHI
ncbi:MAG: hypothetical protein FWD36_08990, partial [Treponema sp.]|nr:hypothetical protein [Treponema sp.]